MRRFGTQGPVHPEKNYVVSRAAELADFVVFDHRQDPEPRVETERIDDVTIWSYVIPVVQERPSSEPLLND